MTPGGAGASPAVGQGVAEVGGETLATRRCFVRVATIDRAQRSVKLGVRRPGLRVWPPKQHSPSHREVRSRPTGLTTRAVGAERN